MYQKGKFLTALILMCLLIRMKTGPDLEFEVRGATFGKGFGGRLDAPNAYGSKAKHWWGPRGASGF